ncbi:MAG: hypothetical protein O6947_06140 [Acidobacteria bacterium]|nr:hypothetical protein [Acidobacteriota bacterium]
MSAKSTSVTVHLPVPQKIDLEGIRKVLVTDFSVEREDPTMDVGLEINRLIRRELAKYTSLEILDMVPPSIPEQAMADLLQNRSFWRQLARANDADLIITGGIEFDVTDRSGFVEETGVSPTTGQRVRSTRFRERQGYRLGLDLAFIHGLSGDVLYENRFIEEITIDGKSSDHLSILFRMFERIRPEVLAVVAPQKKTEERVLLSY